MTLENSHDFRVEDTMRREERIRYRHTRTEISIKNIQALQFIVQVTSCSSVLRAGAATGPARLRETALAARPVSTATAAARSGGLAHHNRWRLRRGDQLDEGGGHLLTACGVKRGPSRGWDEGREEGTS